MSTRFMMLLEEVLATHESTKTCKITKKYHSNTRFCQKKCIFPPFFHLSLSVSLSQRVIMK